MLSWIAASLTFLSIIMTGRKMRSGWAVSALAQVAWLVFAWQIGNTGLIATEIIVFALCAYNWKRWGN
jgi:hypothetical protein